MTVEIIETTVKNILTRTSGYLQTITSHSLQPYRGCTFGNSLCGVGCYVQHNGHLLKGRKWGGFLEVRTNAAESYLQNYAREQRWARNRDQKSESSFSRESKTSVPIFNPQSSIPQFSIFLSSATDPFVPQEFRFGITKSVLEAMLHFPPDLLILQTHSHRVTEYMELYQQLAAQCELRIHVSIETDRDGLPGLPPHATPIEKRIAACAELKRAGLRTIVTVSPLLPIDDPDRFFERIAEVADAVVIDHFIEGDGSADGRRTLKTALPDAMRAVCPQSITLEYRERIVEIASRYLPERVGVNIDGFAGRQL
ncbi:MAG: hypothetical protein IH899_07420 [Planctomycetes bacterium]|nr:hypothetical protein [Planctomycetota bacterium]